MLYAALKNPCATEKHFWGDGFSFCVQTIAGVAPPLMIRVRFVNVHQRLLCLDKALLNHYY